MDEQNNRKRKKGSTQPNNSKYLSVNKGPPKKKDKLSVSFDDAARKEFLTGFRKRKQERRKQAMKENKEQLRKAKIQHRKEIKEALEEAQGAKMLGPNSDSPKEGAGSNSSFTTLKRKTSHQLAPGQEEMEKQAVVSSFSELLELQNESRLTGRLNNNNKNDNKKRPNTKQPQEGQAHTEKQNDSGQKEEHEDTGEEEKDSTSCMQDVGSEEEEEEETEAAARYCYEGEDTNTVVTVSAFNLSEPPAPNDDVAEEGGEQEQQEQQSHRFQRGAPSLQKKGGSKGYIPPHKKQNKPHWSLTKAKKVRKAKRKLKHNGHSKK